MRGSSSCSSAAVSIPRKLKVDCTSGPAASYERAPGVLVKTSLIPLSPTPSLLHLRVDYTYPPLPPSTSPILARSRLFAHARYQ